MIILSSLDSARANAIIDAEWGVFPGFSELARPEFDKYVESMRKLIGKPVKIKIEIEEVKENSEDAKAYFHKDFFNRQDN